MSTSQTTARDVILATIQRARQAGESQEMLARWIVEDLRKAGYEIVPPKPFNDWARIG